MRKHRVHWSEKIGGVVDAKGQVFDGFAENGSYPDDVLELVDMLLAEHGLEVIVGELDGDGVNFRIAKRN